jgi:hypothetical protein
MSLRLVSSRTLVQRAVAAAALALLVLSPSAFAQEVDTSLALREGDEFTLEVTRVREDLRRPERNLRSTTPVRVRVLSVSPERSVLEWGLAGRERIEAAVPLPEPALRAADAAAGDLRLQLAFDSDGQLEGLVNESEVVTKLQAVVDVFLRELLAKVPAEQHGQVRALMAQWMTPEVLVTQAMNDAETYFSLVGVVLEVGEVFELDIDVPHPLTGDIPAVFHLHAESATDAEAVLVTTTTYDDEALREMTKQLLVQSGAPITPEELAKTPPMAMTDDGRYVLDRRVRLFREVVVDRLVKLGPDERHERWEIRLITPPAR